MTRPDTASDPNAAARAAAPYPHLLDPLDLGFCKLKTGADGSMHTGLENRQRLRVTRRVLCAPRPWRSGIDIYRRDRAERGWRDLPGASVLSGEEDLRHHV